MEEKRIIELLTRKFAGEASLNELEELKELLHRHPDSVYYDEFLKQLWLPAKIDINETEYLEEQYNRHKLRFSGELEFSIEDAEEKRQLDYRNLFENKKLKYSLLLLLSVITIVSFILIKIRRDANVIQYTTIITGKGIRKQICLPDGTHVWLNSESKISFDGGMLNKNQREVNLVGEAFFDVVHDKKHPFVVHTDKITIRVIGTAFNVEAYPNDMKSTTTLIRGSIELSVNNFSQQKIILKPSERFALIDNKKNPKNNEEIKALQDVTLKLENVSPVKVGGEEYIAETSWKENKLVFQNESLSELIPKLERWFNVHITVDNQSTMKYHFTGIFTNENIDQALNAMKLIKPFNFKLIDHDVKIY